MKKDKMKNDVQGVKSELVVKSDDALSEAKINDAFSHDDVLDLIDGTVEGGDEVGGGNDGEQDEEVLSDGLTGRDVRGDGDPTEIGLWITMVADQKWLDVYIDALSISSSSKLPVSVSLSDDGPAVFTVDFSAITSPRPLSNNSKYDGLVLKRATDFIMWNVSDLMRSISLLVAEPIRASAAIITRLSMIATTVQHLVSSPKGAMQRLQSFANKDSLLSMIKVRGVALGACFSELIPMLVAAESFSLPVVNAALIECALLETLPGIVSDENDEFMPALIEEIRSSRITISDTIGIGGALTLLIEGFINSTNNS